MIAIGGEWAKKLKAVAPLAGPYDLARKTFELAGMKDIKVTDQTTVEYFAGKEGIASRPLQSTLDLAKLNATGFTSTDWYDDLQKYIEKEQTA